MSENTVDTLRIEIEADAKKAKKELEELLNKIKQFAKYDSAFDGISENALQASDSTRKLARETEKVARSLDALVVPGKTFESLVANATKNMDTAKKRAAEMAGAIGSQSEGALKNIERHNLLLQENARLMRQVAEVSKNTSLKKDAPLVEYDPTMEFGSAFEKAFADSQAQYKKAEEQINSFVAACQKSASSLTKAFHEISSVVKKTFTTIGGIVGSFIKSGISKVETSFSGLNKQLNYFGAAIKNVIVYSAISRTFGAINTGVKTGTNNLYQYSKIISGEFAASMDRLASSLQYFQNSIGAAVAPLINSFAPAIELAVDKVVELINSVNQLFAKLTGASSWTKAVKVQKEYAEAADNAASANKNLLAGFDELNVIQSKDSGSSASAADYSTMFEEVPLDNYTLPDFVQQIKDKIEEGDWKGVGQTLGEKVNEITSNVNWAAAGEKLGEGLQNLIDTYNGFMESVDWSGIGVGLGDALNNLMANVDPESVGAAFAQKWNAITETIYGFITTTDWTAVGAFIAGIINGWFDTIDWKLIGQTASEGIKSLLTALRTAVQETDWRSIGGNISEMLNQIDWSGIFSGAAGLLSDSVKGLLDLIIGFIQGLDWYNLGTELYDSITDSIANIDFDGIASRLMEGIGSALAGLSQFLIGIIAGAWDGLIDWWKETAYEDGQFTMQGLLDGIADKFKNIWQWLKDNVFTPFINGFKNMFGINSPSTVMAEMGGFLIDGLLGGLKDTWSKITTWFSESVSWVRTKLTGGFTDIKNSVVEIWQGLWSGVKGIINSILGGVEKMANGVIRGFNSMITALNKLSFDVPDWVPGIGGETFGFNISKISEISIPRLASGGVVTGPTLAQIGEYPGAASNPEIVAPQKIIYDTVVSANGRQEELLVQLIGLTRQLLQKESTVTLAPSAAWGRMNAKSDQLYAAAKGAY